MKAMSVVEILENIFKILTKLYQLLLVRLISRSELKKLFEH